MIAELRKMYYEIL